MTVDWRRGLGIVLALVALPVANRPVSAAPAGVPPPAAAAEAPAPSLAPEEYAVLGRVIAHGLGSPATPVVIAELTTGVAGVPERQGAALAEYAAALGVAPELVLRWFTINRKRHALGPEPAVLGGDYALMAEQEREAIFATDDAAASWARFFERYPAAPGFLRLSRPAIDPSGTAALVYVEFHCGPECASGRLVHAAREPAGAWRVAGGDLVWMAAPP